MSTTFDPAVAPIITAAEAHHGELLARLTELTEALLGAVACNTPHAAAQGALVKFLGTELLPHAEVEEALLYAAAGTERTALLVHAMEDEHRMLAALTDEVIHATSPMDAAVAAGALVVLCDVRIRQENRLLLPTLAEAGVDLTALLDDAPEIFGDVSGVPAQEPRRVMDPA